MRPLTFVLSAIVASSLAGAAPPVYRIAHTYTLGGDGRWDYVIPDPPEHRVFVAPQDRVTVIDEDTGTHERGVEPGVHVQRRRALLHRDRSGSFALPVIAPAPPR